MGQTVSESRNAEETYADNSVQLRREMSSGIIGLTNGIVYIPLESNINPVAPSGLIFPTIGVSSGYLSATSGITDFTAYNPYIHHVSVGAGVGGALNNAGISNVGSSLTTVNVMNSIVLSSIRFEIYSRKFRG